MNYPELGITIPDACMVVGSLVYCCFNPHGNEKVDRDLSQFVKPWWRDELGVSMEKWDHIDVDMDKKWVGLPVEWVDYTILPPMNSTPIKR